MPKLPEGVSPRVPLNCLITANTRTMLYSLVGELELSQGEVVDRAIQALTVSIAFGPASLNTKKLSKKAARVQALRASDPLGADRPEIEYGSDELPSGGSVANLDAVGIATNSTQGKASVETWRMGRKPLLKPSDRKK